MKIMSTLAIAGMAVSFATASFAGMPMHGAHKMAAKPAAKSAAKVSLKCPVTGDKIASIKDAAGKSTYKGKTYYFCCASCKPAFDKNPAKYAK